MEPFRIGFKNGSYIDIKDAAKAFVDGHVKDMKGKIAGTPVYNVINEDMLICESDVVYIIPHKYIHGLG